MNKVEKKSIRHIWRICVKSPALSIVRNVHVKPNGPYLRRNPKSPDIMKRKPRRQLLLAANTAAEKATKQITGMAINHLGVGFDSILICF